MLGALLTLRAGAVVAAQPPGVLQLPAGARVGIVNLLDPELTHFHAAHKVQDSFLKTSTVKWSVDAMLGDAVREGLTRLTLVPVALAPGETLSREREECFLNANLEKSLAKDCAAAYAAVAAAQNLAALIVLGPGLNNSLHAGAARRKDLPEYLRGWCVVTGEGPAAPVLLNLTELLLIGIEPKGALLIDREWGGAASQVWTSFQAPVDLKVLPDAPLQPLFAGLLKTQAGALLAHLGVSH
jgi:hypothetical protein